MFDTFISELFKLQLLTVIALVLAFGAIAHMLSTRRKPRSMIAWMFVILTIPYIGIPLYVIFSGRKIEKSLLRKGRLFLTAHERSNDFSCEVSKFLVSQKIPAPTSKNRVKICKDGVEAYKIMMDLFENAKKSIYISTYIFGDDEITHEIVKKLCKKAKEGIEVKLLIDSLGSMRLEFFPEILRQLQKAGGEYSFFNSFIQDPIDFKINLRNHRKSIIIDKHTVISGGMNIAKEYMAPKAHERLWVDLSFVIQGEAVDHYLEIFAFDWEYATKEVIEINQTSLFDVKDETIVQVVPSGPDIENDSFYEAMLYALFIAKERIWIVTPYFAPDQSILDALIVAKHRGVEIKITVPDTSDHMIIDVARNGFLRQMQDENIDILFFRNKMLHAKAILVDERFCVMGSANFDERSFFYNYETICFFYSKKEIDAARIWMQKLFLECTLGLKPAGKLRIVFENIFKMLSPAI